MSGAGGDADLDDALLRAVAKAPSRVPRSRTLLTGARVGRFSVRSRLGAGGMGVVYEARDEQLGRSVALKVIASSRRNDGTSDQQLLREARMTAALNHPNIATVFEVGEHEGQIFIAMELVQGLTLRERMVRGKISIDEVLDIAKELLEGLAHAHDVGIVHRDVKPDNVMLGDRLKLLDFGLAQGPAPADHGGPADAHALPGTVAGTPGYMSPEQASGGVVDARSDVFSFGVLLHELVIGKRPFATTTRGGPHADVRAPLSRDRMEAPAWIERIVDRCLEQAAEHRYANAREVLAALNQRAPRPWRASQRTSSPPRPLRTRGADGAEATDRAAGFVGRENELRALHSLLRSIPEGCGSSPAV